MTYKPLQTRLLITIQRPVVWLMCLFGILLLIMMFVWMAFVYGQKVAGYDKSEAVTYINDLQQQLAEIQTQYTESQRQAAMLERSSSIDNGTSEQLHIALSAAKAESLELKKELTFYKSIVTPEQTKRSLAVQSLALTPNGNGSYRYKLMISQRGRNDIFVRGVAIVSIEGSHNGDQASLKLQDISADTRGAISFGFKYFQNFEGNLTIPPNFQPEYIKVEVKPSSNQVDSLKEQFAWSDITAGGNSQYVGQ